VPVKVSHTSEESASARVIDTGGGFLIEETVTGKQSSLKTKVIYDPGCILLVFCLNSMTQIVIVQECCTWRFVARILSINNVQNFVSLCRHCNVSSCFIS